MRHVRAGGHAVVWSHDRRPIAWLLFAANQDGVIDDLAFAVVLSLRQRSWDVIQEGTARGLARLRTPRRFEPVIRGWCDRDTRWPGATRTASFACTECAACCHRTRVVLHEPDLERWRRARRADLGGARFVTRDGGALLLRHRGTACVHLAGTRCSIYDLRPDACRSFPPASEPCIAARRQERGLES